MSGPSALTTALQAQNKGAGDSGYMRQNLIKNSESSTAESVLGESNHFITKGPRTHAKSFLPRSKTNTSTFRPVETPEKLQMRQLAANDMM